jgi:hypothetical protein
MDSIFASIRQYLIVLLVVASTVSVWPIAEVEELDGADSSPRPVLSEESPALVAILNWAARIEHPSVAQALDVPGLILALVPVIGFTAHWFSLVATPSLRKYRSPGFYAHKTGPPLV